MPGIIVERTPRSVAVDLVSDLKSKAGDAERTVAGMSTDYAPTGASGRALLVALLAAGATAEVRDIIHEHLRDLAGELDDAAAECSTVLDLVDDTRDSIEGELDEQHADVRGVVLDLESAASADRLTDHVGPFDLAVFGPTVAALRVVLDAIDNPVT